MFHIEGNKVYINNKELLFDYQIEGSILINDILIIMISPSYENEIQWRQAWKDMKGGNVFAINADGDIIWQWSEKGVNGITLLKNFWIKLDKDYNSNEVIWISNTDMAFLVEAKTGKKLKEINTLFLK